MEKSKEFIRRGAEHILNT
ncbi:MAG: hypothetical protein LN567_03860 [Rickettsia endosymbiont of Graphium doson]|nr:hypothetical protein [Rickettsia endosymbiont of Graphium doson]